VSRHRFFLTDELPGEPGAESVQLPLSPGDLHHAAVVLRVRRGEEVDVVSPGGRVWRAAVVAASPHAVTARVVELLVDPGAADGPDVTLVFGVSKGSKNDDIVQGAVEVGVSAILPVLAARSIVKLDAEKRIERGGRWRRVALAAAKQSKRSAVPAVGDPAELAETLPLLVGYALVLVAWEEASGDGCGVREAIREAGALPRGARVAIVVGPEGGLTDDEVAALERIGARIVTIGRTILRAETAAVIATALVVHELGGLGNSR